MLINLGLSGLLICMAWSNFNLHFRSLSSLTVREPTLDTDCFTFPGYQMLDLYNIRNVPPFIRIDIAKLEFPIHVRKSCDCDRHQIVSPICCTCPEDSLVPEHYTFTYKDSPLAMKLEESLKQLKIAFIGCKFELQFTYYDGFCRIKPDEILTNHLLMYIRDELLPIFDHCRSYKFLLPMCSNIGSVMSSIMEMNPIDRSPTLSFMKTWEDKKSDETTRGISNEIISWLHKPIDAKLFGQTQNGKFLATDFIYIFEFLELLKEVSNFCISY